MIICYGLHSTCNLIALQLLPNVGTTMSRVWQKCAAATCTHDRQPEREVTVERFILANSLCHFAHENERCEPRKDTCAENKREKKNNIF